MNLQVNSLQNPLSNFYKFIFRNQSYSSGQDYNNQGIKARSWTSRNNRGAVRGWIIKEDDELFQQHALSMDKKQSNSNSTDSCDLMGC